VEERIVVSSLLFACIVSRVFIFDFRTSRQRSLRVRRTRNGFSLTSRNRRAINDFRGEIQNAYQDRRPRPPTNPRQDPQQTQDQNKTKQNTKRPNETTKGEHGSVTSTRTLPVSIDLHTMLRIRDADAFRQTLRREKEQQSKIISMSMMYDTSK
jgi:hypothetical protein